MSEATINAAVVTALKAIAGVGAVSDYERYSNDPDTFFEKHFKRRGKVNGWVVFTVRLPSTILTCSEDERNYRTTIRGFLDAKDKTKTDKAARALNDLICNTLDQNLTLSLSATWGEKAEPEEPVTGMVQLGEAKRRVHQITIHQMRHQRVSVTYV